MLPWKYIERVVIPQTSQNLLREGGQPLNSDELLQYIGLWFAMTLFVVDRQRDYWL